MYMTGVCHTVCVSMAICNFCPAVFGVGGQVLVVKLSLPYVAVSPRRPFCLRLGLCFQVCRVGLGLTGGWKESGA